MTMLERFFNALSYMVDLSERKTVKSKKEKYTIQLPYDLHNYAVEAAWDNTLCLLGESFEKNTNHRLTDYRNKENDKLIIDLSEEIPMELLQNVINGHVDDSQYLLDKAMRKERLS